DLGAQAFLAGGGSVPRSDRAQANREALYTSLARDVDGLPFLDGLQHLDVADAPDVGLRRVGREDDEVGEQALPDPALAGLLEELAGGAGGEALEGRVSVDALVGADDPAAPGLARQRGPEDEERIQRRDVEIRVVGGHDPLRLRRPDRADEGGLLRAD